MTRFVILETQSTTVSFKHRFYRNHSSGRPSIIRALGSVFEIPL